MKKIIFVLVAVLAIVLSVYAGSRKCNSCSGGHIEYTKTEPCKHCGGDGKMDILDKSGTIRKDAASCNFPNCKNGKVYSKAFKECGICKGRGYIETND